MDAVGAFDEAISLDGRNVVTWNSRGLALARQGRLEDALVSFDKVLEQDPTFALARFNKAGAEDSLGKAAEAIASFEQFLAAALPQRAAQIRHAQARLKALRGH